VNQAQQKLLALVTDEVASLESLHQILLQEQQALLAADITRIETLTAEKNLALDKQSDMTRQRQLFTEQHTGAHSVAALLEMAGRPEQAKALVERVGALQALADQCRDLNRSNVSLIQQRQQQTRGALQVIRQTGDDTSTYSGRGKTEATDRPRTLGKA